MGAGLRGIPVVDPKSVGEVTADFWGGLRKINLMAKLGGFDEKNTVAESVDFVKALREGDGDYYRILVTDKAHTPVAIAAVSARGFLTSFARLEPQRTAPSRLPAKPVALAIAAELGVKAVDAKLVYAGGTLMRTLLNPVWRVTDGTSAIYVDTMEHAYRADAKGQFVMTVGKGEQIAVERVK
jgi:hypothetical protein